MEAISGRVRIGMIRIEPIYFDQACNLMQGASEIFFIHSSICCERQAYIQPFTETMDNLCLVPSIERDRFTFSLLQ
ncbi:hypothetical protein V202x_36030 [Gimesia aquarii]|uniref:Uncharacterized protein n=1 Tax=Gimesia aquarii TaxID=2527964 RepID=A0A517WY85_9PLAN|nr:hypothetical protein V202x_36030 [Gimesia aquarii]